MKLVILAGGTGTRLWPVSRINLPKQFTPLLGEKTLLEETLDRLTPQYALTDIFISLGEELLPLLKKTLPDFPLKNVIIEPARRDTGPAMGFVALSFLDKFPNEPLAFIPADHSIVEVAKFRRCLAAAEKNILEQGKLVDLACPADFPSTTLGYTKVGERLAAVGDIEAYAFLGHTEKPDFATAKKYLVAGNYWWHENYYMWTPEKFLTAYQNYAPEIYAGFEQIKIAQASGDEAKVKEIYNSLPKISIDYAIMEKIDLSQVLIIKGDFGWSDIGSWETLYSELKNQIDEAGNVVKAKWLGRETSGSLIYGAPDKIIATIGVDNLIIVDTPEALLICPQSRSAEVKKIVEELQNKVEDKFI